MQRKSQFCFLLTAVLLLCSSFMSIRASGGIVGLAWTPSVSTNVTGYNIYAGTNSGAYSQRVAIPWPATNATLNDLMEGTTYYFAATAVDSAGMESPFSNEAVYAVPTNPPAPAPVTDFYIASTTNLALPFLTVTNPDGQPIFFRLQNHP